MQFQIIGLKNKNALRQNLSNRNQENKLDVIVQGNNNFSSERFNPPRGYGQNRISSSQAAPDLSPKNPIPLAPLNQLSQAQQQIEESNIYMNKSNYKRHLVSNNGKMSSKQPSKGQNPPTVNILPIQQSIQQKIDQNSNINIIPQASEHSQKKNEQLYKFTRKSSNQYHTENIINLFLKQSNEQATQLNKNNLSGNSRSRLLKNPQSASQERRFIQSSQGQPQTLGYKLDPIIDEQFSKEQVFNSQNKVRVSDKIDQFLASDYQVQQKNLEMLFGQSQQQGRLVSANDALEIRNTKQEILLENLQDEDQNNIGKNKKKIQIFSSKPLSERFNDNQQNQSNSNNINYITNQDKLQQQTYNTSNETNPILSIKSAQQFQFKSGSKFESSKNTLNTPLLTKSTNFINNTRNNQQSMQLDTFSMQSSTTKQGQSTYNRALNNQNQPQNQQILPEMVIYGQQAIDHSRSGRLIQQVEVLQPSKYPSNKVEQLIAYSTKNEETQQQLPCLISQGGIQQMKMGAFRNNQKEDLSYQQQLVDIINSINGSKEITRIQQQQQQQQQLLSTQVPQQKYKISPSSSHIQKRSQAIEAQIQRKRNQLKPSYLLSDESELALANQNTYQIPSVQTNNLSSTPSPMKQKVEFQNKSISDNPDLIYSESAPVFINASTLNSVQNNQYSQQQSPADQIIELAINNQSQQDQQKRQLLRLNPYKIRYLELQQKKLMMQIGQSDTQQGNNAQFFGSNSLVNGQQQPVDFKGFQSSSNQYSGNIMTSLVNNVNYANQPQLYKYYVGYGNNAELVKRIMKTRDWWCEYNSETQQGGFNFRWTQGIQGIKYEKLNSTGVKQCVNHFEEHREISQKDNLVKNLKLFCETNKILLFSITPCTFLIDLNDDACELQITKFANFFCKHHPKPEFQDNPKKIIADFKKNIKQIYSSVNANYKKIKSNVYSKPVMYPSFVDNETCQYIWLLKTTIYNRGRGIELFSTFDQLEKQMKEYSDGTFDRNLYLAEEHQQIANDQNKQLSPTNKEGQTTNLQQELPGLLQQASQSTQQSSQVQQSVMGNSDQNSALGNKEQAQKDPYQTKKQEKEQKPVKNWQILKSQTFVFQKYIEKPMLIKGRKFDMRMFVLVSHNMDSYFYKCGYIRTASEIYRMDDLENQFIHLTNNAVQKYAKNYGEFEDGNILSLEQFDELVKKSNAYEGLNLYGKVIPTIREICLMTLSSVKKKLNSQDRKHCFELFGFDFFIDEDYRVWLIEVNTNPCIEESNQYLRQFMPRLLDDTFKLTIDQIFPRPSGSKNAQNQNQTQVSPQGNNQNKFNFQKRNSSIVSSQMGYSQINQGNDKNPQEFYYKQSLTTNDNTGIKDQQLRQHSLSPLREQSQEIFSKNLSSIQENTKEQSPLIDNPSNNVAENLKQSRKREKFPLPGHNDDENLWQFMANLNKFNYSTYSYQILSNLSPNSYHPLKDIHATTSKAPSQKTTKKNQ